MSKAIDPWALALAHKGFAVTIACGYRRPGFAGRCYRKTGFEPDDLVQQAMIGLHRAARGYDPAKGEFTKYAKWFVHQSIRRGIAKGEPVGTEPSQDEPFGDDPEPIFGDEWAPLLAAVDRLPVRERQLVRERFGLGGKPARLQREIAAEWGVSTMRVCQVERQALATLRGMLAETISGNSEECS